MERLRALLRLTTFQRAIVLEAGAALFFTWFGLRLLGFRRWGLVLKRIARSPLSTMDSNVSILPAARMIARLEAAAARHVFFRANCLERSTVLWWLLSRRGIPSELRFGAQKKTEKFEAHAWVECQGAVLNDIDDIHSRFVPFDASLASQESTSP